jgi:hypothetical protein
MTRKFESMPKRTKLKPDFRLWLKSSTVSIPSRSWNVDVSNLALSAAAKCFAIHLLYTRQDDMTEGAPNGSLGCPIQALPY